MPRLLVLFLFGVACLGLLHLTEAEELTGQEAEGAARDRRSMPNWALTSSDFFAWVEDLRSHAGYEKMEELARTFWAHFPSASRLGYDNEDPE